MTRNFMHKSRKQAHHKRSDNLLNMAYVIIVFVAILFVLIYSSKHAPAFSSNEVSTSSTTIYSLGKSANASTTNASAAILPMHFTMTETNSLVYNNFRYWAISNYTRNIDTQTIATNSKNLTRLFIVNVSINGTWSTFKGAQSPANAELIEPANGSGLFNLNYHAQILGVQNKSIAQGYVGNFNLHGAAQYITDNSNTNVTPSNSLLWMYIIFGQNAILESIFNYSSTFTYGNQTFSTSIQNQTIKQYGNIVT